MEWSKEDIIRLIETYRKRDVIWDPKHVHHFNKLRKQDAWEEIAKEMGSSADVCKKKMEYLLAALRREKMKMKKSTGTGKGAHETYTSSWFAFESMQFLWDKNQPKPTLSTTATSEAAEEPTEVSVEGEDLNTSLATSQERNPETRHPKSPTPKSKKPKTSAGDQRLDKAFEILTATANQVNDENQHFGNLVASKLRRYDDRVRSLIQNDILNVFVRANTGCYSTDQPFPGNVVGGPQTTHPVGFPPNFWLSHSYSDASESHDSRTSTPAVVQPSPSPSTCSVGNELNIEELI
ncbi:uncharacterized protein LOC123511361 isoform X2 [Portunus trituberculatus]|uniref:uncharacterized protein LOC123511361 isoform X2 n=1 Tax=Portunus trituberculatus TaxID=210409 RepID=UPI001E1CC413|nr:uncharacterized protein LOC123511361 isoform X2 [Portunus trituberculatus]